MEAYETSTHAKELDTIYEKSACEIEDIVYNDADLMYDFRSKFRLLRKKILSIIRHKFKKNFKEIMLITLEQPPSSFISAFRNQYPDKEIKVLVPLHEIRGCEKMRFEYYLQQE